MTILRAAIERLRRYVGPIILVAALAGGAHAASMGPPYSVGWIYPSAATYAASVADAGLSISAYNTSAGLTVALPPNASTLPEGWHLAVANDNGKVATVQVNSTAGGHIVYPTLSGPVSATSVVLASGNYERAELQSDGSGNFRITEATPATETSLGMMLAGGNVTTSGGTVGYIPQWTTSTNLSAGLPVGGLPGANGIPETDSLGDLNNNLISGLPNSQLGTMAANTTKCNPGASSATPSDCSVSQMQTMLGVGGGDVTGPGSSTAGWVPSFADATGKLLATGYPVAGTGNNTIPETDSGGHINGAVLPAPTASVLGGVESLAATAHRWVNQISTAGVPSAAQPACSDLSGVAASCSTDATNAANIGSGTLSTQRLPTHIEVTGTAPSPAANCGTGATTSGNDAVGRVHLGTGTLGGYCQITFAAAWTNAPVCSAWNESVGQPLYPQPNTTSLAILAVTGTLNNGDNLAWFCQGYR